jgi:hypothetical protein
VFQPDAVAAFQQLAAVGGFLPKQVLRHRKRSLRKPSIFSHHSRNPATVEKGMLRTYAVVRGQRRFPDKSGIGRFRSMYLRLSRRMFVASCSLRPKAGRASGNYLRKQLALG